MQIYISWLLQKPTDLDLQCLLRQGMSCSAREGLNCCDNDPISQVMPWNCGKKHVLRNISNSWCWNDTLSREVTQSKLFIIWYIWQWRCRLARSVLAGCSVTAKDIRLLQVGSDDRPDWVHAQADLCLCYTLIHIIRYTFSSCGSPKDVL